MASQTVSPSSTTSPAAAGSSGKPARSSAQSPADHAPAAVAAPSSIPPAPTLPPSELNVDALVYVEQMQEAWAHDSASVPADWQRYFQNLRSGRPKLGPSFPQTSLFHAVSVSQTSTFASPSARDAAALQERVDQMIRNFRMRGHIAARIDPLGTQRVVPAELTPEFYGFTDADLDKPFSTIRSAGPNVRTLRQIVEWLQNTYCRSIGVQFFHIDSNVMREWLQTEMEASENRLRITRDTQVRILRRLTDATLFEQFIAKKFLGKKAFSLQGAESLMPLLDLAIEQAGEDGVEEVVLGMAHRGRLNVLSNIAGKKPREIFREFKDVDAEANMGRGDVKYHLGYDTEWVTQTEKLVHISLCVNPSHLEFVNPVALGRMRAKIDRIADRDPLKGLVILIHGDAAMAGEGVVQETLNLSELKGYSIGGTVHIVINNQVGFTTDPEDARSCTYATDVCKMLQIPIFHVNGEDPEAVAQTIRLAMEFRKKFQKDVVIDMYCYRLRGHNEGDEPEFTQPLMYKKIKAKKTVLEYYVDHLVNMGGVTRAEADRIYHYKEQQLEEELKAAETGMAAALSPDLMGGIWKGYEGGPEPAAKSEPSTGVPLAKLKDLLARQLVLPEGFTVHPNVAKFVMTNRREMLEGAKLLDWGTAESLAFASLLTAGHTIRFSGQDVGRGTFSHRHAVLTDYATGAKHIPLNHLSPDQAPLEIYNSPLSETGVLGFEWGYSLDAPNDLVLWEAQFGDFVNAAQVIIDQFIVSAEDKWRRLSGLVMLLPHGFEGSGPEHSSARLERFLELGAGDNIQVCVPSTPANYFHMLRRQVIRKWRKPLFVMTPKSMLRMQVSTLADCSEGTFQRVIGDTTVPASKAKRILACSGKIYFELEKRRADLKRDDIAIIRLEQLYPLPTEALKETLKPYKDGTPITWVQEEPENMGAWRFFKVHYGETVFGKFPLSGLARKASGSPATGSTKSHEAEQEKLISKAFSA